VYASLYGNKGSVVGVLHLSAEPVVADNRVSGALTWYKPKTITRTYGAGFGPVNLAVSGGYLAPAAIYTVLGLPETGAAALAFTDGGLALAAIDPNVASFTYTANKTVVMPLAGSAGNPGKATLTINKATGAVTGSFTLVEKAPALTRRVTFYGQVVRSEEGGKKAVGYFLLPQIPLSGQTISTSPILSGAVHVSQ
jgi:hypothetical protein